MARQPCGSNDSCQQHKFSRVCTYKNAEPKKDLRDNERAGAFAFVWHLDPLAAIRALYYRASFSGVDLRVIQRRGLLDP